MDRREQDDLIRNLHMGGVTCAVMLPAELLQRALTRLTTCHDHVFVVDRSDPSTPSIGVSPRGLDCLHDEFPEFVE